LKVYHNSAYNILGSSLFALQTKNLEIFLNSRYCLIDVFRIFRTKDNEAIVPKKQITIKIKKTPYAK